MARSTWSAGNCCYFSFNGELRFEGITVTCIIDILHGYTSACYHTHPYIYVQPVVQQDMNSSCHGQEKPTLGSELVDGSSRSQVLSILVPSAGRNGIVSWIYGVVHKPRKFLIMLPIKVASLEASVPTSGSTYDFAARDWVFQAQISGWWRRPFEVVPCEFRGLQFFQVDL